MLRKLLALLSDTLTYGAASLIGQVLNFALLPVYTLYLIAADYGVIGMLMIVTLMFSALSNLGMTNAIFRRYAMTKDDTARRAVLGTGLSSVVGTTLALLLIFELAAEPLAHYVVGDVDTVNLVRLSVLSAAIAGIGTVPRVMLRASRRVRTMATLNVAQVLLTTVPTIWFVVVQEQGVLGVVLGTLIGELLSAVLAFVCSLGEFRIGFDRALWREMLSYGLPFVPHYVQSTALALFGQYMVRDMLGFGEAGLYNMATKFALPLGFVVGAVQNSWTAYKFHIYAEDNDPQSFFRSTFTYYIAGITYLWVGVALWGPEMVRLMTTEGFHDAAHLVWAVSLIPLVQGVYYMSGTGMELSNNTRPFPLVSLAGLVVVVVGAFALVPVVGALGAAVATVLGWVVMSGLLYFFAQRRLRIEYDWATIGCFAMLAAGCVAIGCMVQDMPLAVRLVTALALSLAYPLAAFMFLLRSRQERHRMHILLTKFHFGAIQSMTMGVADYLLYRVAKNWPSPMARLTSELAAEPGTEAYDMAYAQRQFDWKVRFGIHREVTGLDVLEIGAGHGGIACFIAAVGARSVVGIDLNTKHLEFASRFAAIVSRRYGPDVELPVKFMAMSANRMTFPDATFDLVMADNVFEHFTDPEAVMRESLRVLRPGGALLVPVFSSIKSKYGLHLKHGLKLPWANTVCSERTIIRAMRRLAEADPKLYELYPGLSDSPERVRDLRPYKDLNDITYREFKAMAARVGFRVESFSIYSTRLGKVLARVPVVRSSRLMDILSTGAAAYLRKPR